MRLSRRSAVRLKALCPVTVDPQKIEPMVEFLLCRSLVADPALDVAQFRREAMRIANRWIEYRKEKMPDLESDPGGWFAFDPKQLLTSGRL